eukprot:6329188-Karenia_brevis.AAC.1
MIQTKRLKPRHETADWGRHIYRELNTQADELAGRHVLSYERVDNAVPYTCFRLFFDGSVSQSGSGGGW